MRGFNLVMQLSNYDDETIKYYKNLEREVKDEFVKNDKVHQVITRVCFVSKSKGIRNGKRRLRKHWKEVELLKYLDGRFTQTHKFKFDVYATEIIGDIENAEEILRKEIERL
jgi:hypothetical protein